MMEINIFRNWAVICKEPNPWFRMWIATELCKEKLLAARSAFPQYFADGEQQPFVPLTILRQSMVDTGAQLWGDTLDDFKIPEFHWGAGMYAIAEYVPDEHRELVKTACEPYDGLYTFMLNDTDRHLVDFKGETCVVVEAWCDGLGEPDQLDIVPVRFIDFDS